MAEQKPAMRLTRRPRAPAPTPPETRERSGWGFVRFILGIALLAWAIRSLLFAPFSIPSVSMLPTLHVGDYLLVAKWPYGYSRYSFPLGIPSFDGRILSDLPERGDVVVFRGPGGVDFVKRVIGLPGDTVALRGGMPVLNGRPIRRGATEPVAVPVSANSPCRRITKGGVAIAAVEDGACRYRAYRETLPNGASYRVIDQLENPRADEVPPTLVPEGHLFLMGDNRDDSLDSRFATREGGVGLVPVENVLGRATIIYWSTDGTAVYWKPWTWFSALRVDRLGTSFASDEAR
jgi:signal peptidase I